jgi:hypothetical protein
VPNQNLIWKPVNFRQNKDGLIAYQNFSEGKKGVGEAEQGGVKSM